MEAEERGRKDAEMSGDFGKVKGKINANFGENISP